MRTNQNIPQLIQNTKLALQNTLRNEEILSRMENHCYTSEKIQEGLSLAAAMQTAFHAQTTKLALRLGAIEARDRAQEDAEGVYMRLVKLARVALRDQPAAWTQLGLNGDRPGALAAWLHLARQFFTNALADADILAQLATVGISPEELAHGQGLVTAVEAASAAVETARAAALQATRQRDVYHQALRRWMGDYLTIARIALADRPQLLEQLGVVVKAG